MATLKHESIIISERSQVAWLKNLTRKPSDIDNSIYTDLEKEKEQSFIEEREATLHNFLTSFIKDAINAK